MEIITEAFHGWSFGWLFNNTMSYNNDSSRPLFSPGLGLARLEYEQW